MCGTNIKLGLVSIEPEIHTIQHEAPECIKYKDCNTIGKFPVIHYMRIDDSVYPDDFHLL